MCGRHSVSDVFRQLVKELVTQCVIFQTASKRVCHSVCDVFRQLAKELVTQCVIFQTASKRVCHSVCDVSDS